MPAGVELGNGSILSPWVSMRAHGQDEHIHKLSVRTSFLTAHAGWPGTGVQQSLGANES